MKLGRVGVDEDLMIEKRRMRWRMVEAKRREEYGGGRRGTRGNEQGRRVGRGGGESGQGRKWLGRGIRRERKSLARGEK